MASQVQLFAQAIRTQESGGNYTIVNASGHAGAYQFDMGTWQEALTLAGLGNSTYYREAANLAPPSVQDEAAEALMSLYYTQFSSSWYNVAEAWYGGPGAVGNPNEGGGPGLPTVGQYASDVMAIFNSLGGTGDTPPPTNIPLLVGPITSQFAADVGDHYLHTIEPLWAQLSAYTDYTLSNIVTPPTKLV